MGFAVWFVFTSLPYLTYNRRGKKKDKINSSDLENELLYSSGIKCFQFHPSFQFLNEKNELFHCSTELGHSCKTSAFLSKNFVCLHIGKLLPTYSVIWK